MAEQPTEEHPHEEEHEETPGYQPPAEKSLDKILAQDKEDESLEKYKKTLLGENPLDVLVCKSNFIIIIVCQM